MSDEPPDNMRLSLARIEMPNKMPDGETKIYTWALLDLDASTISFAGIDEGNETLVDSLIKIFRLIGIASGSDNLDKVSLHVMHVRDETEEERSSTIQLADVVVAKADLPWLTRGTDEI